LSNCTGSTQTVTLSKDTITFVLLLALILFLHRQTGCTDNGALPPPPPMEAPPTASQPASSLQASSQQEPLHLVPDNQLFR
jgi:hypothetical protein